MAYYNELKEDLAQDIYDLLVGKVGQEEKENVAEIVDDWLNRHNFDLSNEEWRKQAIEAEI